MNFRSAVLSLRDGQAMRTETMRGYIRCQELEDPGSYLRKFNMIFVENSDKDGDSNNSYAFEVAVSQNNNITVFTEPDTSLVLDKQLMELLLSDDWFTGNADVFEQFRESSTNRW